MEEDPVRRRIVDYGGAGACLLFLFVISIVFFWLSPLAWLWILLLFPLGGWGYGRVYYVPVKTVKAVTTYNRLEEPRSPREGRDRFKSPSVVSIEMTELKF